jgi:hypothetical protein
LHIAITITLIGGAVKINWEGGDFFIYLK